MLQGRNRGLPFSPEFVGSDWGTQHQADVVAVNWHSHQVLIGEAKWADAPTDHPEWRDFMDRIEKVVHRLTLADSQRAKKASQEAAPWERILMLFCRRGVTPAVKAAAKETGCRLMTFSEMVSDLERLPDRPVR